jgi:MOSC domain-containing protein
MEGRHPLGTLVGLWRYPVKSLCFEALQRADVREAGLAGDRRSALFVTSSNHARHGKTFRGKEHNLLHTLREPVAAVALAERSGVQLEHCTEGPYFDARPVSLIFDRWIAELEAVLETEIDPLRFRPNLFASARAFVPAESGLVGAVLCVGDVELRVVEPIQRCVTPSYDVTSGERDPHFQRTVVETRNNVMGVYCTVERPGTVAVGDPIERIA